MGSFVLTHEQERPIVGSLLKPFESQVGCDCRAVAFDLATAIFIEELRVVVRSLSRQDLPVLEACGLRVEMPLANHRGLIASFLQVLGESKLSSVERLAAIC